MPPTLPSAPGKKATAFRTLLIVVACRRKTRGFAELAARHGHRKHFPTTTLATFSVLTIATDDRRRDGLARAVNGSPGADLWRFVSRSDLMREDPFLAPIFRTAAGEPKALVKTQEAA